MPYNVVGGLSLQVGFGEETTWNTSVTPTRFLAANSETFKQSIERIEQKALRPARKVERSDQWVAGRVGVAGDLEFEVTTNGWGLIFKHMVGAIASSQPNAGSFPTVWEHLATVGQIDAKSLTTQIGRTDTTGTTNAFTYGGAKIAKWELSCDAQHILMFKPTFDAASESTAVALAAASYPATVAPLVYTGGAITIPSVGAFDVTNFNITGDNGLDTTRYFIKGSGSGGQTKKEQVEGKTVRQYGGQIAAEYGGNTAYNLFVNGTTGQLTAFFEGPIIAGTFAYAVEITCPYVRFDGETPTVPGEGVIPQNLPYKVLDNAAGNGPVQIKFRTTDSQP